MHELTGVAAWDAVGSILVGVLLGVVAVLLIDRNRRFLTGEPGSADLREAAIARVQRLPDVAAVRYLRLEFIGPKQLFLVASVTSSATEAESSSRDAAPPGAELETDPYVVEAVLTVSEPDERVVRTGEQNKPETAESDAGARGGRRRPERPRQGLRRSRRLVRRRRRHAERPGRHRRPHAVSW